MKWVIFLKSKGIYGMCAGHRLPNSNVLQLILSSYIGLLISISMVALPAMSYV